MTVPTGNPPGRPTAYSPEMAEALVEAAKVGVPRAAACRMAGVGLTTLYRWLRWGQDGREPYAGFRHAFLLGERTAEIGAVGVVQNAIRKYEDDPQGAARTAMEWLGRTRSRDYGKTLRVSKDFEVPPEVGEEIVRVMLDIIHDEVPDPAAQLRIAQRLEVAFATGREEQPLAVEAEVTSIDPPPPPPGANGNGQHGGNGSA